MSQAEADIRKGFSRLFAEHAIPIDAFDPVRLVLFPEMDDTVDVPEITEACWGILHKSPDAMMCATSRMVVKRKGAERPAVLACTLLPYDPQFELGHTLAETPHPIGGDVGAGQPGVVFEGEAGLAAHAGDCRTGRFGRVAEIIDRLRAHVHLLARCGNPPRRN